MRYEVDRKYRVVITNTLTGRREVHNDVPAGKSSLVANLCRGKHFNHIRIIEQKAPIHQSRDKIRQFIKKWLPQMPHKRRSGLRQY